jgi:glycosyltransferase involved in cell wall biosynthesis
MTGVVMVCDVDLGVPDATRTHTIEVAGGFAAEGLTVDLVTRGPDPELAGVRHHRAGEGGRGGRVAALNARAVALLRARRGSARRCYVRHSWATLPTEATARALGYRLVTQVDDIPFGRGYEGEIGWMSDRVRRVCLRSMGRLAHGVVAVTQEIADLLVSQFGVPAARVRVLPNGVDPERVRPLDRAEAIERAGLDPACEYAVFTGRFAGWVDFDTMLGAFALVARQRPAARLVLVGDGPQRERVEREVDRLGLRERVVLTGFVAERERVADLLGAATVALAAHRREHVERIGVSPTKVAEYFAAGRAVVAIDMPSLGRAVEEAGAGVVVAPEPEAMAEAIAGLLADPRRADAMGAAGRAAAETGYSWRSVVRRTIPMFGDA